MREYVATFPRDFLPPVVSKRQTLRKVRAQRKAFHFIEDCLAVTAVTLSFVAGFVARFATSLL
jgi:hypothetical protein